METKIEKGDITPLASLKCALVMCLRRSTFLPHPKIELSKKYQIQVSKRKKKKKQQQIKQL